METAFTPVASLGGGALIGAAAVLLMAGLGRIMGATGILAGALLPEAPPGRAQGRTERSWRIAVLLGMVSGPLLPGLLGGSWLEIEVPVSTAALVIGGLLVGTGVTLASGCTSGHGVCGLARLSARSLAAVLCFMATAGATVYAIRHGLGG